MKLRTTVTATALAATLLTVGACSRVAGSAAAVPAAVPAVSSIPAVTVTVTSPNARPAPVSRASSSPAPTNPEPPTSGEVSSPDSPQPTDTTRSDDPATSPDQGQPARVDATTTTWVGSICTGMGNVLGELVNDKPHLAEDASVGTLRQAMVDYYALSTKTVDAAYTDSRAVEPPNVADGRAIHQAYQDFLSGLGDIFYDAALDMSGTTNVTGIEKVNSAVDQRITTLGSSNAALQAMAAGPLADIAKGIPACREVAELSAGA